MKLRLAMLAAMLALFVAPLTYAQTSMCNSTIIDQAGVIHNPQIIGSAARTLINQGADVKIVVVDSISKYGSGLSDVERYLETTCPSWTTNGQRKANLFVVMVAPNDRAKNMFLGSYYNGAFDITSTYSQLSNTYFKNRQWELGLAAALTGTTGQATSFRAAQLRGPSAAGQPRAYTASGAQIPTTPTQQADTGVSGLLIFFIVLLGLGGAGAILYFVFRKKTEESEATTNYGTETVSPTPESYNPSSSSSYPRTYAAAAGATPPVQHTTIINNNSGNSGDGLLTGLVVGEMLSRPNTVYVEPLAPTYVEPTPYTEPAPSSAPDSTWEDTSSSGSSDSSFGSSDSGSSDSSFGGDSGSSGDSGF